MSYYHTVFKFKGKKRCTAKSCTFFISDELNQTQAYELARRKAGEQLQKMFQDIFPDAALLHLKDPEIVEVFLVQ